MVKKRTDRLNSLLKEVISDVIRKEVKNPHLPPLITVTRVDITKDLRYAKVYISVIGDEKARNAAIQSLQSAAGFIGLQASKEVVMRFFPSLTFYLDDSLDAHMRIDEILSNIHKEQENRPTSHESDSPSTHL